MCIRDSYYCGCDCFAGSLVQHECMVESLSVPDGTGGVVLLVAYRIDAAYFLLNCSRTDHEGYL